MASSICCGTNTARLLRLLSITSNVSLPKHYSEAKCISINIVGSNGAAAVSTRVNSSCKDNVPAFLRSHLHKVQQINCRQFSALKTPLQSEASKVLHQSTMESMKNRRFISSKEVTKSLTLFTSQPFKNDMDPKTLQFKKPSGNPLVVIMAWLMAKQRHLKKYAEIYTDMGFDVLVVQVTAWQLLWPVKGTQVVAAETLKFLENNKTYSPIIIHGFSVGAYQLGEVMIQMSRDMERYKNILAVNIHEHIVGNTAKRSTFISKSKSDMERFAVYREICGLHMLWIFNLLNQYFNHRKKLYPLPLFTFTSYKPILDRIVCQVWDSAGDITELQIGVPKAIFPNNPRMESALRNYVLYHMKTFYNQATIHYIRSSQMFHSTLVKSPALFFVSENDPIGSPASNNSVREDWERANVKVAFKCWKHSQHAGHLIRHRDEYLEYLMKHLEDCGVIESKGLKMLAKQ